MPVELPYNPVWRSYAGGRVLRQYRGQDNTQDDHFPEDWLASTVRARNGENSQGPDEGLSLLGEPFAGQILVQALLDHPDFWYGQTQANGQRGKVLWKLLDSSVRLQFQVHPDEHFARRHLHSQAGKTECWYILNTRDEDACVYLGFQHPPTREAWARMIREQRVAEMLGCFEAIPVQPGDCYVVPAGTPHAIGAGVFMMELMEPTDWAVRCETVNAGVTLPPEACFMGLGLEACLDIFDYRAHPVGAVRRTFQQRSRVIRKRTGSVEEEVIGSEWHGFFRLHRIRGDGDGDWEGNELMLAIVTRGRGELGTGMETRTVAAGQTWLLPGAASRWRWINQGGNWEILLAGLPVRPNPASAFASRPASLQAKPQP